MAFAICLSGSLFPTFDSILKFRNSLRVVSKMYIFSVWSGHVLAVRKNVLYKDLIFAAFFALIMVDCWRVRRQETSTPRRGCDFFPLYCEVQHDTGFKQIDDVDEGGMMNNNTTPQQQQQHRKKIKNHTTSSKKHNNSPPRREEEKEKRRRKKGKKR